MEPVFVTNGATLNIPAGTVIRGKLNSNGSLVITRGAKIRAMGTAAQEYANFIKAEIEIEEGKKDGYEIYGVRE
jgi:hypothetical protein